MKGWMKGRTREQGILLAVVGLMGPATAWMVLTAGRPEGEPPGAAPLATSAGAPVAVEFARPDFSGYWSGDQELWSVEGAARLPLAPLDPPPVPPARLAAPPLTPAPPLSLWFAGPPSRWRPAAQPPSLPESWLLPKERFDALAALAIPEPPGRPDRRAERKFENDAIVLDNGTRYEGEILDIAADGTVLIESPARSNKKLTWKKERIKTIDRRYTYLERYRLAHAELKAPARAGDVKARAALAEEVLGWGMLPEAIGLLEEARGLAPRDEALAGRLLELYEESASYGAAAALLRDLAARGGTARARYGLRLGRLLERIGLREAALSTYRELAPLADEVRLAQAWLEWRLGQPAAARQTAAGLPASAETSLLAAAAALTAPAAPGETLEKRLAEVARHVEAAAARAAELKEGPAALLKTVAGVAAALKEEPGASVAFAEAIEKDPEQTAAWVNLGIVYVLAGKPAEARALLAQAARRDPTSAEAAVATGLALRVEGDAKGAAAEMDRALALDPKQYYPFYLKALAAAEPAAAEQDLAQLLRRRYDFAPAYLPAGLSALGAGRHLEAEALLRRAVAVERSTPACLALAALLVRQGAPDEARELLESLPATPADEPAILYAKGFLEYTAGERPAEKRLPYARDAFFAPAAEAGYEPAKKAAAAIADWLATKLIIDEGFDGAEGAEVSGRWSARMMGGVTARFRQGAVRLQGRQKDPGVSQIETEFDGAELWRVEATVRLDEKTPPAALGVSLYHTKAADDKWRGIHALWRRQGAKSAFRTGAGNLAQVTGGALAGQEAAGAPLPKQSFEVRVQLSRENLTDKVQLLVRVDQETAWTPLTEPTAVGPLGGPMMVAIFAGGNPDEEFGAAVDDVRVYTKQERP